MDKQDVIKKAFDIFGETQKEFAQACGVSQGLISQFLTGAKRPGWRTCQKIEQITNGQVTRQQLRPDIFEPVETSSVENGLNHKHNDPP